MGFMRDYIENVVLTFCVTIFPILFTIFFFPIALLLRYSSTVRNFWWGHFFPLIAGRLQRHIDDSKKIMFRDLTSDPNPELVILEIGIGQGANFAFYPNVSKR